MPSVGISIPSAATPTAIRGLASVGPRETRQNRDQRRLSCAIGSQQTEKFSLLNGEIDTRQRLHVAEATLDLADFDGRNHQGREARSR